LCIGIIQQNIILYNFARNPSTFNFGTGDQTRCHRPLDFLTNLICCVVSRRVFTIILGILINLEVNNKRLQYFCFHTNFLHGRPWTQDISGGCAWVGQVWGVRRLYNASSIVDTRWTDHKFQKPTLKCHCENVHLQ